MSLKEKLENMSLIERCARGYISLSEYFNELEKKGEVIKTGKKRYLDISSSRDLKVNYISKEEQRDLKYEEIPDYIPKEKNAEIKMEKTNDVSTEYIYKGKRSFTCHMDTDYFNKLPNGNYDYYGYVEEELEDFCEKLEIPYNIEGNYKLRYLYEQTMVFGDAYDEYGNYYSSNLEVPDKKFEKIITLDNYYLLDNGIAISESSRWNDYIKRINFEKIEKFSDNIFCLYKENTKTFCVKKHYSDRYENILEVPKDDNIKLIRIDDNNLILINLSEKKIFFKDKYWSPRQLKLDDKSVIELIYRNEYFNKTKEEFKKFSIVNYSKYSSDFFEFISKDNFNLVDLNKVGTVALDNCKYKDGILTIKCPKDLIGLAIGKKGVNINNFIERITKFRNIEEYKDLKRVNFVPGEILDIDKIKEEVINSIILEKGDLTWDNLEEKLSDKFSTIKEEIIFNIEDKDFFNIMDNIDNFSNARQIEIIEKCLNLIESSNIKDEFCVDTDSLRQSLSSEDSFKSVKNYLKALKTNIIESNIDFTPNNKQSFEFG